MGAGGKRVGIATHHVGNHQKKLKDRVFLMSIIYIDMRKVSSSMLIISTTLQLASLHENIDTYVNISIFPYVCA